MAISRTTAREPDRRRGGDGLQRQRVNPGWCGVDRWMAMSRTTTREPDRRNGKASNGKEGTVAAAASTGGWRDSRHCKPLGHGKDSIDRGYELTYAEKNDHMV